MIMKIAVIGSGSWGTAASVLLAKHNADIYLWSWQQSETDRLNRDRENKEFLPGIILPENIICTLCFLKRISFSDAFQRKCNENAPKCNENL